MYSFIWGFLFAWLNGRSGWKMFLFLVLWVFRPKHVLTAWQECGEKESHIAFPSFPHTSFYMHISASSTLNPPFLHVTLSSVTYKWIFLNLYKQKRKKNAIICQLNQLVKNDYRIPLSPQAKSDSSQIIKSYDHMIYQRSMVLANHDWNNCVWLRK